MAKLSNLILMIELLKTGRKYSLNELSKRLEVSERVIREYKLFLEEAGIYIDTIRGPYGGYILRQEVNLPNLLYHEKDIETLKESMKYISNHKLKEKIKNLYNKMDASILSEKNENQKLITDNQEQKVFNKISKALKYHYKIKIKYYNLQYGESVRTIYPLGLYLFQNEWWVSSYWEEKDDMRQFHLKRIKECEILNEKFNPKEINIKF